MSLTRINEEGLSRRRDRVARLKDRIRALESDRNEIEAMAKARHEDIWTKHLSPGISKAIAANQEAINAILGQPTKDAASDIANLKAHHGGIQAYKNIQQAVENTEAFVAEKDKEIEARRKEVAGLLSEITQIQQEHGI